MGRRSVNTGSYHNPFWGWEAQVMEVIDDSSVHARPWGCAAGRLRLLPHYKNRRVSWGNLEDIGLDVSFRCYDDKRIEFLRTLDPGTWVIVDGELHKRTIITADPFPEIDSGLYLKGIELDPWQGTRSPRAASLYTSDDDEFKRVLALAKVAVG